MNGNDKKTVLYITLLPPPDAGIQSWTASILANGLPDGFVPAIVDASVQEDRKNWAPTRLSFSELKRTARILGGLISGLIRHRPQIVHLNCCMSPYGVFRDLICALITRLAGVPLVTHYHADFASFPGGKHFGLSLKCLKRLANLSQLNIVLNDSSLADITAMLGVKKPPATVLPNFIDDRYLKVRPDNFAAKERCRIAFVGRISVLKGCREIFAIAARLPEADFALIGVILEDMAAAIEAKPANVHLLGPMEREAVIQELGRSDIFLFPSHTEGFPVAVLEAMTVGLPVVATRVGAIPQMLEEGGGGFLADIQAVEDMYQAVKTLVNDAALRNAMGDANKKRSRQLYGYSAVIKQLVQNYNRLLSAAN